LFIFVPLRSRARLSATAAVGKARGGIPASDVTAARQGERRDVVKVKAKVEVDLRLRRTSRREFFRDLVYQAAATTSRGASATALPCEPARRPISVVHLPPRDLAIPGRHVCDVTASCPSDAGTRYLQKESTIFFHCCKKCDQ